MGVIWLHSSRKLCGQRYVYVRKIIVQNIIKSMWIERLFFANQTDFFVVELRHFYLYFIVRLNILERPMTGSLQYNRWIPEDKTVISFLQRDLSKHHNILSVCSECALFWHYLGKINRFFTISDLNVCILEDFIFPTSETEVSGQSVAPI